MGEAYFAKRARTEDMPGLVRLVLVAGETCLIEREPMEPVEPDMKQERDSLASTASSASVVSSASTASVVSSASSEEPKKPEESESSSVTSKMDVETGESDVIISDEEEEEIVDLVTDGSSETDSEMTVDSSLSK